MSALVATAAVLPGTVMVGAGALCLFGAALSRRWVEITAAVLMLLAMADLAFFGLVPRLAWAGSLVIAGLLLGFELRREGREALAVRDHGAVTADGSEAGDDALAVVATAAAAPQRIERGIAVATAVAYPAMAWLILAHGSGATTGGTGSGVHAGHGSSLWVTATAVTLALAAVFGILALLGAGRRRWLPAFEAVGMGAMLLAMLLPHG